MSPEPVVRRELPNIPAPRDRGPTYTEIANRPLGRVKLWLGYSVIYPGLSTLPLPDGWREQAVRATRHWLHGDADEHDDLMALIEHGILIDEGCDWPT